MKQRSMILAALALLVAGALIVAYLFLSGMRGLSEDELLPPGGNAFGFASGGVSGTDVPATTRTILVGDTAMTVPDFTEGKPSVALSDDSEDLQYDLTPYPDFEPGKPYPEHAYDVQFNEKDSSFIVTLNVEPLGSARLAAEAFLREALQLSDTALCAASIAVGVPYSVNQSLSSYQNLGLSFCPGSYPLPS
jgi:hypothetical protein